MSGDEVIVTLASLVAGAGGWAFWFYRIASIAGLRAGRTPVSTAAAVLGAVSLIIMIVLRTLAADDVRHAPPYLFMYFVLGLAWLRLTMQLYPLMGLNPRDDIFERGNRAAFPAWAGGMVGVALCYSGGNIGNGPGWWVVVFSALLSTAALAAVWFALGTWAHLTDAVVIDRDPAAGVRLGSALAACGLIFGTSVAGDWISAPATVVDFVMRAWPATLVLLIAIGVERGARPRPEQPKGAFMTSGVVPALLYLGVAAALSYRGTAQW